MNEKAHKKAQFVSPTLKVQLSTCVLSIIQGDIDEDKMRSLFIHIREHADKDSLTRDIADFFAHPERNRGATHSRIAPTIGGILRWMRGETSTFHVNAIDYKRVLEDLNVQLLKLDVLTVPEERFLDAALILYLSMQGLRIEVTSDLIVPFSFAIFPDEIVVACHVQQADQKHTAVFPVFSMPNHEKFTPLLNPDPLAEGWPLIRTRWSNGKRELYQQASPIVFDFDQKKGPGGGAK